MREVGGAVVLVSWRVSMAYIEMEERAEEVGRVLRRSNANRDPDRLGRFLLCPQRPPSILRNVLFLPFILLVSLHNHSSIDGTSHDPRLLCV